MLVADVCVNVSAKSINKTFTYAVPPELSHIVAGWRVMIPFGSQRVDGFVTRVIDADPSFFDFELKPIEAAVDDEAWFTQKMIFAAQWLSNFYLCPLAQTMGLFMPGNVSKKIAARFEDVITPKVELTDEIIATFNRKPAQQRLLTMLKTTPTMSNGDLRMNKISSKIVKALVDAGFIEIKKRRLLRDSYAMLNPDKKSIDLTDDQRRAIDAVSECIDARQHRGFLLHGVTGSGKTQVYIELTKRVRSIGRRAVILVPEIALTGQIVTDFKRYFDDVIVIHSRLSIAERSDAFYKIRSGEVGIVIGARSALFTPIDDVGLYVVDEEQDFSYKQDRSPHYHARVIAESFAQFQDAPIVLGSATPSLESYHRAKIGELTLLSMPTRIDGQPLPDIKCVDMRGEFAKHNFSVLSDDLLRLLKETFAAGQQSIILLNRRGFSTFVMCRKCGAVITCPDCMMPMTYHVDGQLRCHHCDTIADPPEVCPQCGSKAIKYFGSGTQKLEQTLNIELPAARILRMDRDTTNKKFAHQTMLTKFKNHEYDILLGTQMVAKGHDIDNVTAVGILSADSSLNIPDFRASELCFDLITQAAGRAGRGELNGHVIVQVYNPDHPAITCGCRHDYEGFAAIELPQRESRFYPPYSRLIKLLFVGKDAVQTKTRAREIVDAFIKEIIDSQSDNDAARSMIMGPAEALIAKLRDIYRFIVLIKTSDLDEVRAFLRRHKLNVADDVTIDIDPSVIL